MNRRHLAIDANLDGVGVNHDGGRPGDVTGRYTVAVGVHDHAVVGLDISVESALLRLSVVGPREQQGLLPHQTIDGTLTGGSVNAHVGDLVAPPRHMILQILEIGETKRAPAETIVLEIMEDSLDDGMLVRAPRVGQADLEVVSLLAISVEARIDPDLVLGDMPPHRRHIVIGHHQRNASHPGKCFVMERQQGLELFIESHADDAPPAERKL